jgi:hypothetical protein
VRRSAAAAPPLSTHLLTRPGPLSGDPAGARLWIMHRRLEEDPPQPQWMAIHSELMILRAIAFFELVIQEMNFAAAPLGAPLVTIQKLRTP